MSLLSFPCLYLAVREALGSRGIEFVCELTSAMLAGGKKTRKQRKRKESIQIFDWVTQNGAHRGINRKQITGRISKQRKGLAHVISFLLPKALALNMDPSCALHTATGLLITRLQTTIQPSASPVTRRLFDRMNAVVWIWEAWPRRIYAGCGNGNAITTRELMLIPQMSLRGLPRRSFLGSGPSWWAVVGCWWSGSGRRHIINRREAFDCSKISLILDETNPPLLDLMVRHY
jgi:hypothetical protein